MTLRCRAAKTADIQRLYIFQKETLCCRADRRCSLAGIPAHVGAPTPELPSLRPCVDECGLKTLQELLLERRPTFTPQAAPRGAPPSHRVTVGSSLSTGPSSLNGFPASGAFRNKRLGRCIALGL